MAGRVSIGGSTYPWAIYEWLHSADRVIQELSSVHHTSVRNLVWTCVPLAVEMADLWVTKDVFTRMASCHAISLSLPKIWLTSMAGHQTQVYCHSHPGKGHPSFIDCFYELVHFGVLWLFMIIIFYLFILYRVGLNPSSSWLLWAWGREDSQVAARLAIHRSLPSHTICFLT